MGLFDGKVALVTGGASGIGRATVERLTADGARVCVVDVDAPGGVDIAFLNAGIAIGVGDVTELTDDVYRRIMRINVDGVVFGTRAAVRVMRERGGGAIVATSSLAGLIPFPPDPVYDATKHAVVGFVRSVAPTLQPLGITANTVNPGMTDTNIIGEETKQLFAQVHFPLMPRSRGSSRAGGPVSAGCASPAATRSRTGSTTSPARVRAPRGGCRRVCVVV